MKIIYFVTGAPFPFGGAATARKYSLCKGLLRLGYEVHVISTGNQRGGKTIVQEYDGIKYHTSAVFYRDKKGLLAKAINHYLGKTIAAIYIWRESMRYNQMAITMNSCKPQEIFPLWLAGRLRKAFFFTELNENPLHAKSEVSQFKLRASKLRIRAGLNMYDKIFTMTYSLQRLLRNDLRITRDVSVLHNAVDLDRFRIGDIEVINHSISYAGSLSLKKDRLDILLEVLSELKQSYPAIRLRIAYMATDKHYSTFWERVESLRLVDYIDMYSDVPNSEIPRFLAQSDLLILLRTANLQTDFGFPTKLVEYLASGRPVVCSSISDIPIFLTHMQNVYLLAQTDIIHVKLAIIHLFQNMEIRDSMGNAGREACETHFNPITEGKKIAYAHENYMKRRYKRL
jgi:glycosyltransferase involved in cell wall biosynthesis